MANAIGDFCDGRPITEDARKVVIQSLRGTVLTSDRGERVFYAHIDTANLRNVDTDECIWSAEADFRVLGIRDECLFSLKDDGASFKYKAIPLPALHDAEWLLRVSTLWTSKRGHPNLGYWQKFWKRIGRHLVEAR